MGYEKENIKYHRSIEINLFIRIRRFENLGLYFLDFSRSCVLEELLISNENTFTDNFAMDYQVLRKFLNIIWLGDGYAHCVGNT